MKKQFSKFPLILIILIVILGIFIYLNRSEKIIKEEQEVNMVELLTGYEAEKIGKIEIESDENKVELLKQDDTWLVVYDDGINREADQVIVAQALEAFSQVKNGEIVSKNQEKLDQFDLTSKGIKVTLHSGDNVYNLVLGKNGNFWPSQYLLYGESKEVVLIKQYLRSNFENKTSDDWRDRVLIEGGRSLKDKVVKLEFSKSKPYKQSFVINKQEDEKWQLEFNKKEVSESKMNSLLTTILNLRAIEFVKTNEETELAEYGLENEKEEMIISLTLDDESQIQVKVGIAKEEGGNYYIMLPDNLEVYVVTAALKVFFEQDNQILVE